MEEYKSPIEQVLSETKYTLEDHLFKAIQTYGFTVDKEELEKALLYDRDQYNKGYTDAKTEYEPQKAKWILGEVRRTISYYHEHHKCSNCGEIALFNYCYNEWCDEDLHEYLTSFCPECGARMIGEE